MKIKIEYWKYKDLWMIIDTSSAKNGYYAVLYKNLQWQHSSALEDIPEQTYATREEAEEYLKKWLDILPKEEAEQIFAEYIAQRMGVTSENTPY